MDDKETDYILQNISNIDLYYLSNSFQYPIHYAAFYNKTVFFDRADLKKKSIDVQGGIHNSSPLIFAIYNSNYKVMLFLLLNDTNLRYCNDRGYDCMRLIYKYDDVLALILMIPYVKSLHTIHCNKYTCKKIKKLLSACNAVDTTIFCKNNDSICDTPSTSHCNGGNANTIITTNGIATEYHAYTYTNNVTANYVVQNNQTELQIVIDLIQYNIQYPCIRLLYLCCIYISSRMAKTHIQYHHITMFYPMLLYNNRYYYIFAAYYSLLLYLMAYANTRNKKNKMSDTKELVTDLVLDDKFSYETFCYVCLNTEYSHCNMCKYCVPDRHHHCVFLNNCVQKNNMRLFYVFVTITIASLVYSIYNSTSFFSQVEYSILTIGILSAL